MFIFLKYFRYSWKEEERHLQEAKGIRKVRKTQAVAEVFSLSGFVSRVNI